MSDNKFANDYPKHLARVKRFQKTPKGKAQLKARSEAIKIIVKKHRKEFDKIYYKLIEEYLE